MSNATPEGYKKRGVNVVGFWNPELGPIHCIPKAAKLFDGNIDKYKPSTLIIVELVEPCLAITAKDEDDEKEIIKTEKGDVVGIWGKPGMAAIKTLAGEPCIIQFERDASGAVVTKKMKKGNPMKCFDVLSKRNPMKTIPVIEDSRRESAHVNTLLAPAKSAKPLPPLEPQSAPATPVTDAPDDDDVPF